jgi:triacylglycerol esterase/lipase EstA (alpha/beta hydrolase family)
VSQNNPIEIVHGWSDGYKSFQPLKDMLVNAGHQTQDVFLGNYASMRDDVTFDDVSYGLQMRLYELVKNGKITGNVDNSGTFSLKPFSLNVIVHSTGGPLVRNWLSLYLRDVCGGDFTKSPIRHPSELRLPPCRTRKIYASEIIQRRHGDRL